MFVGTINADMRSVLAEIAPQFKGLPVYVGCSGNFTVERILAARGCGPLFSNDISLYSSVVGGHLSGTPLPIRVRDPELEWLSPFLEDGLSQVATVLLCTEYFKYVDRAEPFHVRMRSAYEKRWTDLHARTRLKAGKLLADLSVASYTAADVVDFMASVPSDAAVIAFPPTYERGYETLYKVIDRVFEWEAPSYEVFSADRLSGLLDSMMSKRKWLFSVDHALPGMESWMIAQVQTGMRSHPVYMYSNAEACRLTVPRMKTEDVPLPRCSGPMQGPLGLVRLSAGQMNQLRSEYLSTKIVPATATVNLGVLWGGSLVGAFSFVKAQYSDFAAYMMSDFAVRPCTCRKLSKLVLAAALSYEAQAIAEMTFGMRIEALHTTAFTSKPSSMKYRGLFEVLNRKDGMVNYVAKSGRWSLAEGLEWWTSKNA
jgi:hypothetical protein